MPRAKLKRYFRRGGIMWILQDDKRVAGELFADRGRVLKSVVAGIADGDPQHVQLGALSATYCFMSQWAEQQGFRQLDWGGCDPSLASGILTTKKRWGAELHCDAFQRFELFFAWRQFGPEIRQFLNTTPLIIWHRGELTGLVATASDQPANTEEIHSLVSRHWIDGLQRIIVSAGGDQPDRGGQSKPTDSLVWLASPGTPRECLESARPAPELQPVRLSD